MEKVLVINRLNIPNYERLNGFLPMSDCGDNFYDQILKNCFFMNRDEAEKDIKHKQIIPAILITNDKGEVFLTRRLNTQGESRLHGKHSLIVGGHINPIDEASNDLIAAGFIRELFEELIIDNWEKKNVEVIGVVNFDKTNDLNYVGNVHIGIVHHIKLPNTSKITIKEKDKMIGGMVSLDDAEANSDNMEKWAQLIFNHIKKAM